MNVRIPGRSKHPMRINICSSHLGRVDDEDERKRIQKRADEARQRYGLLKSAIDWGNFDAKLNRLRAGLHGRSEIDRESAQKQILKWYVSDERIEAFSDASAQSESEDDRGFSFLKGVQGLSKCVARKLQNEDPQAIQLWIEDRELPRLVHRFHSHVMKQGGNFCRLHFLRFAASHLNKFGHIDYLRSKKK